LAGSSTATLRLFAACRIELATAFATVMGAAAGCTIGLLLMSRFWWCAREGRLSTRVSRGASDLEARDHLAADRGMKGNVTTPLKVPAGGGLKMVS
jgi:hypothetical protein